jgi:osmoprotectant transport system ATP-binding protein
MHVSLDNVSKRFGASVALAPTSIDFDERRTTVLIGPSGSGKSTLLRIIIGLVTPDAGRVVVDGSVVDRTALQALRTRTGYVIQEGGLFPHLDAASNVTLMARELAWTRESIRTRLDELLPLVRLERAHLERYPSELSGGQRQRVGLMRALMLRPELLLLDEPLGALDPMVRYDLQVDLRAIFASLGTTVVMVTHDLGEAAYLGDRIVLMRDGAIVQRGTAEELQARPADSFVTRFINAQRAPLEALR